MSAGKALYMKNVPGSEIAAMLGVSETTVSNWVTKSNWREERIKNATGQKTMQERLFKLIEYQLEVMDHAVDNNRAGGNLTSLDKGQIYTLRQMLISLNYEADFSTTLNIIRQYVEHINRQNPDLAKILVPHTNEYVQLLKEKMTA